MMKNRIDALFQESAVEGRKLLSLYFCAGYPTIDSTRDVLLAMQRHKIDMVEVGIPFSDPLADGPIIQAASSKALHNGMTLELLFEQLESVREQIEMPIILMGYLNVIMHYGFESFFQRCSSVGVSGCIIPDLPFRDYLEQVKPIAEQYNQKVIMMITPETSDERIRMIDLHTQGFIYMVSSAGITGVQNRFDDKRQAYFSHVENLNLKNPRMIGFGISNKQTLEMAQQYSSGAIIGSKFVQLLGQELSPDNALSVLLDELKK